MSSQHLSRHHRAPIRVLPVLAATLGLMAVTGVAWSAPPAAAATAAQDRTTRQLEVMEQEMMPPPVNPTDIDRDNPDNPWSALDTDGDGRISREEGDVDPDFSANFDMVDTDRDGYINRTEMDARDAVEDTPEPEEQDEY
jgi:hypothetical protein